MSKKALRTGTLRLASPDAAPSENGFGPTGFFGGTSFLDTTGASNMPFFSSSLL